MTKMTNELEPLKECPFQKEGELHIPVIIDELGEAWVRCSCDVSSPMFSGVDRKEKATEFWNTRHKLTCKIEEDPVASRACMGDMLKCSECGASFPPINFDYLACPSCGAEVVDGD